MIKIPKSVLKKIERKSQKSLKKDYKKAFKKAFDETKKEMIKEFLSHPVTIEILSGPGGSNISGTLAGKSNLFAFIGFNTSEQPIDPILQILENISYSDNGESTKGRKFNVSFPTSQDIFNATPMPWASGRSWSKGIESGISGLGYLLNKSTSSSRSGVAIQADKKVRTARFKRVPYISSLLKKYKKKFKNIK
jgi:hypothetical protein